MSDTGKRLLGGRYEVDRVIGRGGMAQVRRARDLRLGRDVAVKELRIDLASDPTFQARFRREAQAAAGLNHPNIVAVYDTGEAEDPGTGVHVPYIVMELVEGRTLRDILREGRPILPRRALEFTQGVLDALAYSHRAGIIHRDIKPANVMITNNGLVKVMDFGIARAVSDTASTMTQTAAVIGTAQYLSPEQARAEQVDARSDLYSAGCLLYELLVGRPPFQGDSPVSVAYQHVREAPVPPSQIDPEVTPAMDAIVLTALAKDPNERYQSASAMRQDIARLLAGQAVQASIPTGPTEVLASRPASPVSGATAVLPAVMDEPAATTASTSVVHPAEPQRRRRNPAWIILGLLLTLALIAVAGYFLVWEPSQTKRTTVPWVVGQKQAVAEQMLRAAQLEPVVRPVQGPDDDTVGEVTEQQPPGNASVAVGSTVEILINQGPRKVAVPKGLLGQNCDEAENFLNQNDFANVKKQKATSEPAKAKKNEVVTVSPKEGSSVAAGTQVTLTCATGLATVPNVASMTEEDARNALNDVGFTNITTTEEEGANVGRAIRTDPEQGKQVEKSTKITIVIAKAAPEPPPTTPPPTTTEPTESPTTSPTSPSPSATGTP